MEIFVAGGTGAIGRPLIVQLRTRGHTVVALSRSPKKALALVEREVEPAIADVFDTDAVKAVLTRAQPEVLIEQLTAVPKPYTRESKSEARRPLVDHIDNYFMDPTSYFRGAVDSDLCL